MLSVILFFLVILFVQEVVLGSSTEVYNAEIGYEAKCDRVTRITTKQFFTELLPIITLCLILPVFFII
jgi:hypothetical protein